MRQLLNPILKILMSKVKANDVNTKFDATTNVIVAAVLGVICVDKAIILYHHSR